MTDKESAQLLNQARGAARNAHAPYSGFQVGAALLCPNGKVYTGCNVENASYGLTICAERAAFATAVARGEHAFTAIAIAAPEIESGKGDEQSPGAYPCGACLQVMAEFCPPDFPVFLGSTSNEKSCETYRLGELLPHPFSRKERSVR